MFKSSMWRVAIVCGAITAMPGAVMADEADAKRISLAKEAVAYQLFDPGSATFREVRMGVLDVCGEVNAKNRFGGYVGYRTFWVLLPEVSVGEDPRKLLVEIDGPDATLATRMCRM